MFFGVVGYRLAYTGGQLFREGLFQFMTSFSLPWYAIVGAQEGVTVGLPVFGCLLLAVVGPTAGRYYIDITSGVPPKQFIRGEWFVAIAALTGLVWILLTWAGVNPWWAGGISFAVGFSVRMIALYRGWEEPLAKEPSGVYQHSDGRPMLGRKLAGKSEREMRDLGLVVENGQVGEAQPTGAGEPVSAAGQTGHPEPCRCVLGVEFTRGVPDSRSNDGLARARDQGCRDRDRG